MLGKGLITQERLDKNQQLLKKIANGEPVPGQDGKEVVLDEVHIRYIAGGFSKIMLNIDMLFTK
ncbi:hypothetical protein ACFVRR_17615 [Gottfriedia sp. NPDC057948]|uniref:hypothetical protein n=1 Tax=Gottfriedia sp. NPDC057948 TaxID=3346287 RepID=UPI0036DF0ACF